MNSPQIAGPVQIDELLRAQARQLADHAQFLVDLNGRILSWNIGVQRILGYAEAEFVGKPFSIIFNADDIAAGAPEEKIRCATEKGRAADVRWHIRRDGRPVFVEGVLTALYDEAGAVIGFSNVMHDLTERKLSEALLEAILEGTDDAMFVKDVDGRYLFANSVTAEVMGVGKQDIVGRTDMDLLAEEVSGPLRALDLAVVESCATRTVEEVLPGPGADLRTYLTTKAPWLDPNGNVLGVIGIARDITGRKNAEEALRDSETALRAVFENASQGIISVTPSGTIAQANDMAGRLFGYALDELVGQPLDLLIPGRFRQTHQHNRATYFSAPRTRPMGAEKKLTALRKDGSEFPVEISLSHIETKHGKLAVAFISDITERKAHGTAIEESTAALLRSNEDLERFASIISHDLQEPLRVVSSYTSLLARRYQGHLDSEADLFVKYILDATGRMQQLIRHLLEYSRLTTHTDGAVTSVPSERALRDALDNLKALTTQTAATVTYDRLPEVPANPEQLTQVFQNLISNALKYRSAQPPNVHISAGCKNGCWVFSVRDNGIGFDPAYAHQIFGMFKRLHKEDVPGTGIGLAICKRVIERHGGTIWAESVPGEGSTFRFTLPTHQRS